MIEARYLKWLMDWSTASSNSMGPGIIRAAWGGCDDIAAGVLASASNSDCCSSSVLRRRTFPSSSSGCAVRSVEKGVLSSRNGFLDRCPEKRLSREEAREEARMTTGRALMEGLGRRGSDGRTARRRIFTEGAVLLHERGRMCIGGGTESGTRSEDPAAETGRRIDVLRRQLNAFQSSWSKVLRKQCFGRRTMSARRERMPDPRTLMSNAAAASQLNAGISESAWVPRCPNSLGSGPASTVSREKSGLQESVSGSGGTRHVTPVVVSSRDWTLPPGWDGPVRLCLRALPWQRRPKRERPGTKTKGSTPRPAPPTASPDRRSLYMSAIAAPQPLHTFRDSR